jgi:Mor family transcriptional regulator
MQAMAKHEGVSLVEDLIVSCAADGVTSEVAQKAISAVCRYFGGQMVYIPGRAKKGKSARTLRGVVADAVGDGAAQIIVAKIMRLYGNMQLYIPLERRAFIKIIALEIYARYGNDGSRINDLAREYGVSFTQACRLWKEGQHEKPKPSMPYLELAESNNPD